MQHRIRVSASRVAASRITARPSIRIAAPIRRLFASGSADTARESEAPADAAPPSAAAAAVAGVPTPISRTGVDWSAAGDRSGHTVLVRDFINSSLYSRESGYFNNHRRIHSPAKPLDFGSFRGRREYERTLDTLYRAQYGAWLTPVEIFQPHYARAILNWMLQTRGKSATPNPRLRIVEVGGGSGRCACDILDALRDSHPALYAVTEYTIVDASAYCTNWQASTLASHINRSGGGGGPVIRLVTESITNFSESYNDECFVFGLEVLDNMAHDKVVLIDDVWQQVVVRDHSHAKPQQQQTNSNAPPPPKPATPPAASAAASNADPFATNHYSSTDRLTGGYASGSSAAVPLTAASDGSGAYVERFEEQTQPLSDRWIVEWMAHRFSYDPSRYAHARHSKYRTFASRVTDVSHWLSNALFANLTSAVRWDRPRRSGSSSDGGKASAAAAAAAVGPLDLHRHMYAPTVCTQFLSLIARQFPRAHVLLCDFNYLPDTISGENAPIVTQKKHHSSVDASTYLVTKGTADIMFPTDFGLLQHTYHRIVTNAAAASTPSPAPASGEELSLVYSNADFMVRYADVERCRTASGWNPLKDDYSNFSFFVTNRRFD